MAFVPQARGVEIVEEAPGRLSVRGALTFQTARYAYQTGAHLLRNAPSSTVQIDCAGVTQSDSAGLAVLIEWLACAAQSGRKMTFLNLPVGIRSTAQISEVLDLLEAGTQ